MSITLRAAAITIIACLATGCAAPQDRRAQTAVQALDLPRPSSSVQASTPTPLCTTAPAPSTLPAPGKMPAGSRMAQIRALGHLTVGVDQNSMLLAYFDPAHDTMQGFEVDLAREIAYAIFGDRDPSRLHFIALLTTQRKTAVMDGTVDLAIDAITMTCTSAADVAFSTVYLMAHQRTLVQADSSAKSLADLRGRRVCATNGSTALTILHTPGLGVIPYPVAARTDCLVALQSGTVDGIQSDDAILDGIHEQDPYTKILVDPPGGYTDEPYGIAISKRYPELVGFVDAVLARVMGQSNHASAAPFRSWTSMYRQWFTPVTGQVAPRPPQPATCHKVLRCPS